ncbi:heme-binding protein, partial [bacterium]|nr:heme-binding protein [bacterium]
MAIEHPSYDVILSENSFELRSYEPLIVAITDEDDLRGNSGFGEVFDYIQGN